MQHVHYRCAITLPDDASKSLLRPQRRRFQRVTPVFKDAGDLWTSVCTGPLACLRLSETRERVKEFSGFPAALTAHRTFVRVNFGVISVRARRRSRCGKEDLHALCRDVIRSRRCTGCIVPLRGVRMEGSGLSLGKSRGRSRSGFGSSRVRGLRRGRFHRDGFSLSRLFFPCSVSPCVGGTHFFVCPFA